MTDKKYPIVGYAPGTYQCKCVTCGNMFIGDKQAVQCESCARKSIVEHELILDAMDFYWRAIQKMLLDSNLGDIERRNYQAVGKQLKDYITKHKS